MAILRKVVSKEDVAGAINALKYDAPINRCLQFCSDVGTSDGWGHLARMDNVKLPLQMMFSTLTGSGARGRPTKSWNLV